MLVGLTASLDAMSLQMSREIMISKKLSHPFIVQCCTTFFDDTAVHIVQARGSENLIPL